MTDKYHDTENAAQQLGGLSPRTLEKWRLTGEGPAFRKFGKKVVYAESDLEAWAKSQRRTSTSQE
jgi:predicted site-specific integrase-resolvase